MLLNNNISVIAGEGFLPVEVIKELLKKQNYCNVIIFNNFKYNFEEFFTENELQNIKIFEVQFRISFEVIDLLLHKIKCNKIVFCGKVHYFGIKSIMPKFKDVLQVISLKNLKIFFRLLCAGCSVLKKLNKGDDFLLSLLVNLFEVSGIKVVSIDEILTDILCSRSDNRKNNNNFDKDLKDGQFGIDILDKISDLDIGQSIIVQNGRVIGIEASEGTDELIKRCFFYTKKNIDKKAVFCKSSKVNQNMKIDIAAIGCETLDNICKNEYSSIVLKENKVLIIDRKNFFKKLDDYKINLIVIGE